MRVTLSALCPLCHERFAVYLEVNVTAYPWPKYARVDVNGPLATPTGTDSRHRCEQIVVVEQSW